MDQEKVIFDIGGGNGYTTHYMQKEGYITALLEPTFAACFNAQKRGLKYVVCGTLTDDTVKDNSMEQILLLDVLEHIEDDAKFLKTMWSKLKHGGRVLLTVPAFGLLWSSEDDAAGHYRRYEQKLLKGVAQTAGFEVEYINYFYEFLFTPILFVRVFMEKIGLLKRNEDRSEEEKRRIEEEQFKERKGLIQLVLNIFEKRELKRLLSCKKVSLGSSIFVY